MERTALHVVAAGAAIALWRRQLWVLASVLLTPVILVAVLLTYMGGIERGKRNPSLLVLARIAEAMSVEPADLLRRG